MTELTEARKEVLLAYCRIDELGPGEDALLGTLYANAVGCLSRAGISEPEEGTDRRASYDLCVNYLVLDAYDRREAAVTGTVSDNPAFRRLLNQLKLSEPAGPPPQTSEAFAVGRAGGSGAVGGSGEAASDRSGAFDGGVSKLDT